jgi:hypothetical protein
MSNALVPIIPRKDAIEALQNALRREGLTAKDRRGLSALLLSLWLLDRSIVAPMLRKISHRPKRSFSEELLVKIVAGVIDALVTRFGWRRDDAVRKALPLVRKRMSASGKKPLTEVTLKEWHKKYRNSVEFAFTDEIDVIRMLSREQLDGFDEIPAYEWDLDGINQILSPADLQALEGRE